MTGQEAYKEFDNASIVTSNSGTGKSSVSFGRYTFRKRDVLLGGIAVAALAGVIILAIVLATVDSWRKPGSASSGSGSAIAGKEDHELPICVSKQCLQTAIYQKTAMNDSVKPCDNFYAFACGHYADHHPMTPFMYDVTPVNEVAFENVERIVDLLNTAAERREEHSYERKIKDFMDSCTNHFDKMDRRGRPLLQKVIIPLGGWYALDTYNNATFDFYQLFKRVKLDYWTSAFFTFSLKTDLTNWNKKIVEFSFGGMRLHYLYYSDTPFFQQKQQLYRSYMKIIARMLAIDAGLTPNDDLIDTFVADAFEVEYNISKILDTTYYLLNNHAPDKRLTVAQLHSQLGNTIDLVDFLKSIFNEWPSRFDSNTEIAIDVTGYFADLGTLINSYLGTEEGNRKLHNYLMWQVIDTYAQDLSWDYVHIRRKFNHLTYGYKDESSGYLYCFNTAESIFADGLSALYVKEHITDTSREEAMQILEGVKAALVKSLDNLWWMQPADQDTAIDKIRKSIYKIGYPDNLADENYLDNLYYYVKTTDDFFENVLESNKVFQKRLNDLAGRPDNKDEWPYHVFNPVIAYYNPWSELIVTYAMLQSPLFHNNGPAYYNYGGIGSRMAKNLIHAIDELGSTYRRDGSHFGSWWSNATRRHYQDIQECAVRSQNRQPVGPFRTALGTDLYGNASKFTSDWTPEVLASTGGIRLAYQAYKEREKKVGQEKAAPGLQKLDADKLFFLSYAQSFCQNVPEFIRYNRFEEGKMPKQYMVNMAVRNIPEFQEAFSCPKRPAEESCLLFEIPKM